MLIYGSIFKTIPYLRLVQIHQRYMKKIIALLTMLVSITASADRQVCVVDKNDSSPIVGATVIGKSGMILGLTNDVGQIRLDVGKEFPITVRCIGYDPLTITEAVDSVRLAPAAIRLNEVVFSPKERPIMRVLCFAREYCSGITGTDTLQMYTEHMAEAFVTDGKVKGYNKYDAKPWPKAAKRYARFANAEGLDSVARPKHDDDVTGLSWFTNIAFLPDVKESLPEAIRNGAEADSLMGKYANKFTYKKKNGLYTVTCDMLADHKNHRWSPFFFKLIGFTTEILDGYWTHSFAIDDSESYGLYDFVCGTYSIHMIGKGRWLKKLLGTKYPIEMDCYVELYPVSFENCTVEEYKAMKDDFSRLDFIYPENLQPLSPAVRNLIDRIDREIP